jgi:hypothetical protein
MRQNRVVHIAMASKRVEKLLRAGQVSAAFSPLIPQLALMRGDHNRRTQFAERLRHTSDRLGGIYPWLTEFIADLPTLAGPRISVGLSKEPQSEYGPFTRWTANAEGDRRIQASDNQRQAESDIDLLNILLRLLSPITGNLNARTINALLALLRTQVSLESSLQEEHVQRSSIGLLGELVKTVPLTHDGDGTWSEPPSGRLEKGPSRHILERIVKVWSALVVEHAVVPARMDWGNCALDDTGRLLVLGRLAGSTHARQAVQLVVIDLQTAQPPDPPHSLLTLLAAELNTDVTAVSELAATVMNWVDREAWAPSLGPLATVRLIDRSSENSVSLAFGRDTSLVIRQLALFRSMADDLGVPGSYFSIGHTTGD